MEKEAPFFADRRKRAGLVRRIGNLANKLPGLDPELEAMWIIARGGESAEGEAAHLRQMMASQAIFVSPVTTTKARIRFLAERAGIEAEIANQTTYLDKPTLAPETMRAAFTDVASLARKNLE